MDLLLMTMMICLIAALVVAWPCCWMRANLGSSFCWKKVSDHWFTTQICIPSLLTTSRTCMMKPANKGSFAWELCRQFPLRLRKAMMPIKSRRWFGMAFRKVLTMPASSMCVVHTAFGLYLTYYIDPLCGWCRLTTLLHYFSSRIYAMVVNAHRDDRMSTSRHRSHNSPRKHY